MSVPGTESVRSCCIMCDLLMNERPTRAGGDGDGGGGKAKKGGTAVKVWPGGVVVYAVLHEIGSLLAGAAHSV